MKRRVLLTLALVVALGAAVAIAQSGSDNGVIGPQNRIQPSGRQLKPTGKLTKIGNHPGGGAITTNGRFLWTLSAGRGRNDIRIVRVDSGLRCRPGKRGAKCRKRDKRLTGKVIQKIQMPGLNGGMAMAPDGHTAYVSGTPETEHDDQKSPEGTPGKSGDVIHIFHLNDKKGTATRAGTVPVPPPAGVPAPQVAPAGAAIPGTAGVPQSFPPTETKPRSWPRDLAVSRDGNTLVAALNLADRAAIVNLNTRSVSYVQAGSYPYGAGITRDGKALISNEADGTVSVIDIASKKKLKDIQVGPHLSHPEGIAIDPKADRAYVAVAAQDLIAVIDTKKLEVERSLSVERPQGIGTEPTQVSVTRDGCRLMSADSGEDAIAVFALRPGCDTKRPVAKRTAARRRVAGQRQSGPRFTGKAKAESVLQHEARKGVDYANTEEAERAEVLGEEAEERAEAQKKVAPVRAKAQQFQLLGRIPVASYPVATFSTPARKKLAWIAAKGLGVGPNPNGPNPTSSSDSDDGINKFKYLPSIVTGMSGIARFPTDKELRIYTPRASRQIRPVNGQAPPSGTPISESGKIEHVFYIVRENRTYDQILGDDPRGNGDPNITLFGEKITPNAHALAKRFPLLDHVYANSEASIDGHFWTSAANVSDYVTKNWHQNYGGRGRPYDFGTYSVTWPSQRFLFDQAEKQGISYFNYGEAVAGTVPLTDKDRTPEETQQVERKFGKSDLGPLNPGPQLPPPSPCYSNDASSGGTNVITMQDVYDSSRPAGANPLNTESRTDCFKQRLAQQTATGSVPKFNYIVLPHDHTAGTKPGARTPRAMVADNDLAMGQIVEAISKSNVWDKSLILVIEDDSQDGADHVDAHRIPAFAISPYAKRGAVIHTRYDFLSFIRTLQIPIGMKPLNLFDALAVPMYDVFDSNPGNSEAYTAVKPEVDLLERNGASTANAKLSAKLPLSSPDRVPQRILDRIVWQSVHGADSEPPPPGPNSSGVDEAAWRKARKPGHDVAK